MINNIFSLIQIIFFFQFFIQIIYNIIYKSTNLFNYMDTIGMVQKTNFHVYISSEYKSTHIEYMQE